MFFVLFPPQCGTHNGSVGSRTDQGQSWEESHPQIYLPTKPNNTTHTAIQHQDALLTYRYYQNKYGVKNNDSPSAHRTQDTKHPFGFLVPRRYRIDSEHQSGTVAIFFIPTKRPPQSPWRRVPNSKCHRRRPSLPNRNKSRSRPRNLLPAEVAAGGDEAAEVDGCPPVDGVL